VRGSDKASTGGELMFVNDIAATVRSRTDRQAGSEYKPRGIGGG